MQQTAEYIQGQRDPICLRQLPRAMNCATVHAVMAFKAQWQARGERCLVIWVYNDYILLAMRMSPRFLHASRFKRHQV